MQKLIHLCAVILLVSMSAQRLAADTFNIDNYADNAPGTQFLERGVRFYQQGDYKAAHGNFLLASRWADKMAQFNLGMMYVNGQHFERDPLRGWAWIKLAAERGYPQYVEVAEDIWRRFSDEHREVARRILEQELKPEFGDEVTIDRTAMRMRRDRARVGGGGSRVGVNRALYVTDRGGNLFSGTEFYDPDRWDFRKIVQFETRLQKAIGAGNVTLRNFNTLEDEDGQSRSSPDAEENVKADEPDSANR
ncbi:MAG: hypothetical protein LC637_05595 [Xanthomonadaceae bacterium]|nr:hypothetical protein [Xanthomonadaceae bacterium]